MRSILIIVSACFLGAASAQAAPSVCKGMDQTACAGDSACTWREALVAGETVTKAGTPAKRSVKAHCRKAPAARKQSPKPAKTGEAT